MSKTTSGDIINKFKDIFSHFGIPKIVRSDNGPQFNNWDFKQFAHEYRFKWISSSPLHAQSNGQAENAVKLVKNILKKCEDPFLGLLVYRNTPLSCGVSPAQLLMGRALRDVLPVHEENLKPKLPDHQAIHKSMLQEKEKTANSFNKRHRTKPLKELKKDDVVYITDKQSQGIIVSQSGEPRSYLVETDKRKIRRNRKFLVPLPTEDSMQAEEYCTDQEKRESEEENVRKSSRLRKKPIYLKDFV